MRFCIVIASFAALAIAISLICLLVIAYFSQHHVIRAAQPEFIVIIVLGSILCYISVYCWLYCVTDAGCTALPWARDDGILFDVRRVVCQNSQVVRHPSARRRIPIRSGAPLAAGVHSGRFAVAGMGVIDRLDDRRSASPKDCFSRPASAKVRFTQCVTPGLWVQRCSSPS